MNIDQFHALMIAVQREFETTSLLSTLERLRDGLQNQINSPQEPAPQQQVSKAKLAFESILGSAPSNEFPPQWIRRLEELGVLDLLAPAVSEEVEELLERNQITPSVALQETKALHSRVSQFIGSVRAITTAFQQLEIPADDLAPGHAELGISIPRNVVDNALGDLGSELVKLNKLLGVFEEICTGTRPGFAIRGLASSDFSVALELSPKVAACLAIAIERIVALYKSLLEIRRLRAELSAQGVPKADLSAVDKHANAVMAKGIEPLVNDLLDERWTGQDKARRNEVANELRGALHALANRLDAGYGLEVRAGAADSTAEEDAATSADISQIAQSAKSTQFIRAEGPPILQLPETTEGPISRSRRESQEPGRQKPAPTHK